MKSTKYSPMLSIPVIILFYIGLIIWLEYSTTADKDKAAYTIGFVTKEIAVKKIMDGSYDADLEYLCDYAALSNIVYENEKGANTVNYELWTKLDIAPRFYKSPQKKNLSGLYYEVWMKKRTKNKDLVSIVFKGTSSKNDWDTNFRWVRRLFTKKVFDYYDQLNVIADSIISDINTQVNGNAIELTSTGHSLGGGLAQFMAYRIEQIKKVYAFNSSPVTGYYDIEDKDALELNKSGCKIYRIYESGEALTYVRKFLTILYPAPLLKIKNPAIIRVRFSFVVGKDLIYQHGIKLFLKNLKYYK